MEAELSDHRDSRIRKKEKKQEEKERRRRRGGAEKKKKNNNNGAQYHCCWEAWAVKEEAAQPSKQSDLSAGDNHIVTRGVPLKHRAKSFAKEEI